MHDIKGELGRNEDCESQMGFEPTTGFSVSVFFFMRRKKDAAVRCLRLQQHARR